MISVDDSKMIDGKMVDSSKKLQKEGPFKEDDWWKDGFSSVFSRKNHHD